MPVDTATVLHLWEHAAPLDEPTRAAALAGAVAPAVDVMEVLEWPLGRRDDRLLRLREAIVGPDIEAVTSCTACGEDISFELDTRSLVSPDPVAPPVVELDGWRVTCRAVTTTDLLAAAEAGDQEAAEQLLLNRVVTRVEQPTRDQRPQGASEQIPVVLPGDVRRAVAAALATADPLAEVVVGLACPECGTTFHSSVDVAAFAWSALDGRARGLLHDVNVLARAYGWTEAEVLALGDRRRASYLELVRGGAP